MRATSFIPAYRPRNGPLHAAHTVASLAYLAGICVVAFAFNHPLVLGGLVLALLSVAALAGVVRDLRPFIAAALAVAALVALINPLVSGEGDTVLLRGPVLPLLGAVDITLESCVFGALMGLRVAAVMLAAGLYTVAVDPDRVFKLLRRVGFRSAITAAVATRLVPTLGRDAQRLNEALLCRPRRGGSTGRLGRLRAKAPVLRALMNGALERAVDVAMALEVRGFGRAVPSRGLGRPWNLNDATFLLAGLALLAVVTIGLAVGVGQLNVYPGLGDAGAAADAALAGAVVLILVFPLAYGRRIAPRSSGRGADA